MVAKIEQITTHGDVHIETETQWEYFENFDDLLTWVGNDSAGDFEVKISEADRSGFANGEEILLMAMPEVVDYRNGQAAVERCELTATLFGVEALPEGAYYLQGDSGSVIAFSDGQHVDTVWGKMFFDGEELDDGAHAFFEEFLAVYDKIKDSMGSEAEAQAKEYAHNCVDYHISDMATSMEAAIAEYVGA